MPTFFDERSLTEEQRSRWDASIIEYNRVQRENAERDLLNMTDEERSRHAARVGTTDEALLKSLKSLSSQPGDSKSALFARLLNGQKALEFRPPLSYSYPWYDVIEEPGPHHASLGLVYEANGSFNRKRSSSGSLCLTINQSSWKVRSWNAAAQALMELDIELEKTAQKDESDKSWPSMIYDWSDSFYERVRQAYAQGPEFIVQYGYWPEFRLFVSQIDGHCHKSRKDHAASVLAEPLKRLKRVVSVFDLDSLYVNGRIGKTLSTGQHPWDVLNKKKLAFDKLIAIGGGSLAFVGNFEYRQIAALEASLESDTKAFELQPDMNDWVELFLDSWCLQRVVPI